MNDISIQNELTNKIKSICRDEEEIEGILCMLQTDKYRKKMIDFLTIAEKKKDFISGDQLLLLTTKMSNEELNEFGE